MCLKPSRQYLFLGGDEWLKSKQELAKFGEFEKGLRIKNYCVVKLNFKE